MIGKKAGRPLSIRYIESNITKKETLLDIFAVNGMFSVHRIRNGGSSVSIYYVALENATSKGEPIK